MKVTCAENLIKNCVAFHSGSLGQEYSDTNDYFSVTNHEADQQEELEYEVGAPTNHNKISLKILNEIFMDVLH